MISNVSLIDCCDIVRGSLADVIILERECVISGRVIGKYDC